METIRDEVVKIALSYIGQREIAGNLGFIDKAFEAKMRAIGWNKTEAWCAYFAELVWIEAYRSQPKTLALISALFSPSAIATLAQFTRSKYFKTGKEPIPGAVAIWQHGFGWTGHAGIVIPDNTKGDNKFSSAEGNTDGKGGREGVEVAIKQRPLDFKAAAGKLNLKAFIYPI